MFDKGHPERREKLPSQIIFVNQKEKRIPGFVRLPTEIEWEYAARGGYPAIQDGSFDNKLPFDLKRVKAFSWNLDSFKGGNLKAGPQLIGKKDATSLGLFDMFGNVEELTSDLYRPEVNQGKPGGIATRGGSYLNKGNSMRSSFRSEFEIYSETNGIMAENQAPSVGLRLAIGATVKPHREITKIIRDDYSDYIQELRHKTSVGLGGKETKVAVDLQDAAKKLDKAVEALRGTNEPLRAILIGAKDNIYDAKFTFQEGMKEKAISIAKFGFLYRP